MQLTTLRMQYFGPYCDETVDFSAFRETPVFLISGKTGSGKTTIFDAMVFALYGTTTGDERLGKEMRANFATPEQRTKVTLTFTHGGKRYVMTREPEQLLAKKRGDGLTTSSAKVSLRIFQGDNEEDELIKQRTVQGKIEDLLHLDANQFRQMVLLPQGKFRQFLDASSDDKETLLRRLFGTDLFGRWQDALKDQAKAKEAATQKQTDRLATLATQFDFGDVKANPDAPLPDQLAAMTAHLGEQTHAVEQQKAQTEKAKQAFNQVAQAEQAAVQLQKAFADRQAAKATLASLASQSAQLADTTQRVTQLQWVEKHLATATQLARDEEQLAGLQRTLTQTQADAAKAQEALRQVQITHDQLAAKQKDMNAAQRRLEQLKDLGDELTAIASLAKQVKAQQTVVDQANAAVNQATVALAEHDKQVAENSAAQHKLSESTAASDVQRAHRLMDAIMPLANQKSAWETKQAVTKKNLAVVQMKATEAAADAQAKTTAYDTIREQQIRNQIADLVGQLKPGSPCPVCGSTTHPAPAQVVATAPVTKEAINAADNARQSAADEAARTDEQLQALQKQAAEQQQEIDDLNESLSAQLPGSGELNDRLRAVNDEVQTLQAKADGEAEQQAKLDQQASELAAQTDQLQQTKEQASHTLTTAQQDLIRLTTELTTDKKKLPTDAPSLADLNETTTTLTTQLETYHTDVQNNQAALTVAQQDNTRLATTVANQTAQYGQAEKQHKQNATAFGQALQDFFGEGGQAKFTSLQPQIDQLPALQEQLSDAATQQAQQEALLHRAEKLIGDQHEPDLTGLSAAKHEAEDAYSEATAVQADKEQALRRNRDLVTTIRSEYETNKKQLTEVTAMQNLVAVMNGTNEQRLSLERYVLQAYLEQVLEAANQRLKTLSNGRYLFSLHTEPGSSRKASGLEIDVYDDEVGETRSVHTLSGGESFIAALSLALALGEVIQRQSGGVSIDALFVDEGFGSLDTTSLNTALEALETIEGQARMIGIISHVTELRDGIPDQLQVIPTGAGDSHLKVVHLNE